MAISANSTKVYTTQYSNLKGVDFSSGAENVYAKNSPTAVNMISDNGGNPKKRPGWKTVVDNEDYTVKKLWSFNYYEQEHLICQITDGDTYYLSRLEDDEYTIFCECDENVVGFYTATDIDSVFNVIFSESMYEYLYDEDEDEFNFVEIDTPYVPTVFIGTNPTNGGGTEFESLNLLTKEIKQDFIGTSTYTVDSSNATKRIYGKDNRLFLCQDIDKDNPIKIVADYCSINENTTTDDEGNVTYYYSFGLDSSVNGSYKKSVTFNWNGSAWSYDSVTDTYNNGTINHSTSHVDDPEYPKFDTSLSNVILLNEQSYYPVVDGEDNISVTFTMLDEDGSYAETQSAFLSCERTALYENRVWLTGANGDYGNRVWYSDITQDAYYPELNYVVVGSNDTDAIGLVNLGEYLGVVKEPSSVETTVYLIYSTTFDNNSTYACRNYVSGVGALAHKSFANIESEALFLSRDGIYGLTSTAIKNRSYYVNKKLCQELNLDKACAVAYNGYYILCVNKHCYIMDTRQKGSWGTEYTNYIYTCFYWTNVPAVEFAVYNNLLWFIHEDGRLCSFKEEDDDYCYRDDVDTPIFAEWSTPLDDDGATQLYKTLQKKGTVATLKPYPHTSVDLYINVDDKKLISIGRQYNEILDFGEVYFDRFTFASNDAPMDCFFKKKVKKYKRLQFILRNNTLDEPFMVEAVSKSYTVQGYSKRKSGDGTFIEERNNNG